MEIKKKIKDLVGKEVCLFPADTHPKYGKVLDMSPDGRGILLELTRKTHEASRYRAGETVYFSGSFVLKVVSQAN